MTSFKITVSSNIVFHVALRIRDAYNRELSFYASVEYLF
jgi:hypothetical protein